MVVTEYFYLTAALVVLNYQRDSVSWFSNRTRNVIVGCLPGMRRSFVCYPLQFISLKCFYLVYHILLLSVYPDDSGTKQNTNYSSLCSSVIILYCFTHLFSIEKRNRLGNQETFCDDYRKKFFKNKSIYVFPRKHIKGSTVTVKVLQSC